MPVPLPVTYYFIYKAAILSYVLSYSPFFYVCFKFVPIYLRVARILFVTRDCGVVAGIKVLNTGEPVCGPSVQGKIPLL